MVKMMSDIEDQSSMFEPEDLHPDLVPFLNRSSFGKILQHPLIYSVPYTPLTNKMLNKRYEYVKQRIQEAIESKKWSSVVFLHERPYRTQKLYEYSVDIFNSSPKTYWELLASVWVDTENVWQNHEVWDDLWSFEHRLHVMDKKEITALEKLPRILTVYRGITNYRFRKGLAWTLDQKKAEWFSKRFANDKPC